MAAMSSALIIQGRRQPPTLQTRLSINGLVLQNLSTISTKGGPKSKVQVLDIPTWNAGSGVWGVFFFLLHQGTWKIKWLA